MPRLTKYTARLLEGTILDWRNDESNMICVNTILLIMWLIFGIVCNCLTIRFYLILLILLNHDLINFGSINTLYSILKMRFREPEVVVYKSEKLSEVFN